MKNVTFLQFNTNRQYSENGQVIQCRITEYKDHGITFHKIAFLDVTRDIIGLIDTCGKSEQNIINQYDNGQYENLTFSHKYIRDIKQHFSK